MRAWIGSASIARLAARSFLLILDDEGGPPLGGNEILTIAWNVWEGKREIRDGLEVLGYKR